MSICTRAQVSGLKPQRQPLLGQTGRLCFRAAGPVIVLASFLTPPSIYIYICVCIYNILLSLSFSFLCDSLSLFLETKLHSFSVQMGVGKGISLAPASLGVQRRECRVWDSGVERHQRAHPAPLRDSKGRTEVWPPLPPGSYWEPDEVGPPGVDPLGISRAWALWLWGSLKCSGFFFPSMV